MLKPKTEKKLKALFFLEDKKFKRSEQPYNLHRRPCSRRLNSETSNFVFKKAQPIGLTVLKQLSDLN